MNLEAIANFHLHAAFVGINEQHAFNCRFQVEALMTSPLLSATVYSLIS
jgi:hypothetical protein